MDLIRQLADTGDQSRPRGDRDIAVRARIHEHLSDLRLLWTMPDTPLGDSFDGSISGRTWPRFADGKLGRFTQKISDRLRVTGIEGGAKWIDEFNEAFEFSPAGDPMLAGDRKLCVRQHGAFISFTMVLNALERRGVAPDGVTKQVFGLPSDTARDWDAEAEGWPYRTFLSRLPVIRMVGQKAGLNEGS